MRTALGAHDDDEFMRELHQNLIDSLSESELQTLCAKLKVNYDRLPGKSKAHKVDALISNLRRNSRIHKIAELYPELPHTIRPKTKSSASGSHQSEPVIILTRRERREKHEAAKLENRRNFLQQFFRGQPIALEKELCESWECAATKILYRFRPGHVERLITLLSRDFDSINFIDDLKRNTSQDKRPEPSTASARQSETELEKVVSLPNPAFINYHSICYWYRNIRADAKSLLTVPSLVAMMTLLLIAAYTAGVVLALSGVQGISYIADESKPGIVFTVPESGTYYVKVKDASPRDYSYLLGVTPSSYEVAVPDFSETDIWPLSAGDRVFAKIHFAQHHIYRIDNDVGERIVVNLYRWYADADLDFALLDSEMNECAAISLLEKDLASKQTYYLTCSAASPGPHFLRVQMTAEQPAGVLALSSRYGFQIFRVSGYAEIEPNDSFDSSTEITQGTILSGELSSSDQDFYCFTARAGERLEIGAVDLSDSSLSSITLYRLIEGVPEVIAHSTRSVLTGSETGQSFFETSRGRAYALSLFLQSFGVRVSPASLSRSNWEFAVLLFPSLLLLILMTSYAFFVTALSTRKYEESLAIRHMVNVLQKLGDDALRSESKKASIRLSINRASDTIRKIHRISSFPAMCAASTHMEDHMAKIASRVRKTNEVVSTPGENGLPSLRRSYIEWLDIFLNAEYGRFHFWEGFKVEHTPWHQKTVYAIQQYWKDILGLAILAFFVTLLTQPLWTDYWTEIATSTWLIIRYMILIVVVQALYSKWGSKDPSGKPASKWENAVRLILFFFVPLFALDAVLQTGIIASIIQLVGSLKIF
jgi:hypothetical protein